MTNLNRILVVIEIAVALALIYFDYRLLGGMILGGNIGYHIGVRAGVRIGVKVTLEHASAIYRYRSSAHL